MKNKKAVGYGIISGLFAVLFGSELFQFLAAFIAGNVDPAFRFNYVFAVTEIYADSSVPLLEAAFLYLSPIFFLLACVEFAHYLMKKTPPGTTRYSLVIFNLIIAGYLIIKIFYGAFVSITAPEIYSDWSGLLNRFNAAHSTRMVLAVFSIILLAGYFNFSSGRILKYIEK